MKRSFITIALLAVLVGGMVPRLVSPALNGGTDA
jgi:hypothetical protein